MRINKKLPGQILKVLRKKVTLISIFSLISVSSFGQLDYYLLLDANNQVFGHSGFSFEPRIGFGITQKSNSYQIDFGFGKNKAFQAEKASISTRLSYSRKIKFLTVTPSVGIWFGPMYNSSTGFLPGTPGGCVGKGASLLAVDFGFPVKLKKTGFLIPHFGCTYQRGLQKGRYYLVNWPPADPGGYPCKYREHGLTFNAGIQIKLTL